MKEAKFLAGVFFDFDIPREKKFLFKYFRSELEKQFVKYYLCFGEVECFSEHTGYLCQKRWIGILKKRFDKIITVYNNYKTNFKLTELKELENGKYKF